MGYAARKGEVADLQDRLLYVLKSISFYNLKARAAGLNEETTDRFFLTVSLLLLRTLILTKKQLNPL